MRPPLRAPRIVAIVLLAFFSNGVRNTVVVISATELFRRQTRTTVDHSLGQSGLNVQLSPPITPQSSNAVVELSTVRDSNLKHLEHILGNLSRLKFATEVQAHEARKNIIEAIYRIRSKNRSKCFPSVGVSRDLMSTTRLSGGAEQEQKAGNISERGDPTSAPDDNALPKNSAFLGNLETLRQRSMNLPRTIIPVIKKVKSVAKAVQSTSSRAVPPFVTTLSLIYTSKKGMSAVSLYALALLGASCGFHLFLHFITIGYALGIGVPLSVALYVYNKHSSLPRMTFFHAMITVTWSFRMFTFFVWREYVSWPALHEKVIEIQRRMSIPFASKLLCWLVYSFFYFAMMSMSWSRLQQGINAKWGILGFIGLLLQIGGLGIETIADLQKNGFKSRNRHAWCNVGVWKWSTHPNYLGEGLFWWGAYLSHGFHSISHTVLATTGLCFIMSVLKGSTRSLSIKHMEKYGDQPDYFEFQRTHSIWGPKEWWWWLHGMEHLSEPNFVLCVPDSNNTNVNNSSASDEATVSLSGP